MNLDFKVQHKLKNPVRVFMHRNAIYIEKESCSKKLSLGKKKCMGRIPA